MNIMTDSTLAAFTLFTAKYRGKFKSISNATRKEYEPEDVQNEAWMQARIWELENKPISFDDPVDVDKLFAYLYTKLVKRTEKIVRTSVRLDHNPYADASENDVHPALRKLADAQELQPLEILLAREANAELPPEPKPHETRASAYLHLVQRYNNQMKDVASHLLISPSYCYYRLNEARGMANKQLDLPDTLGKSAGNFVPGPWRSFGLTPPSTPPKLELPPFSHFWDEPLGDNT